MRLHTPTRLINLAFANCIYNCPVLLRVQTQPLGMNSVQAPRKPVHFVAHLLQGPNHLGISMKLGKRCMKVQIKLVVAVRIAYFCADILLVQYRVQLF